MRRGFITIILLYFVVEGFGQNFTLQVPIDFSEIKGRNYSEEIDLSSYKFNDFISLSFRIDGEGIGDQIVGAQLITSDTIINVKKFHEEELTDRYVSELIYLDKSVDKIDLRIDFKNNISSRELSGFVRIFSPGEVEKIEKPKKKTAGRDYLDCNCEQPAYILRTEWGSNFDLTEDIYIPPATYTDVTHLIIHHGSVNQCEF
ncbi:MAG: hypothetical protein R2771_07295 [Saprospiraceae bacterium]